MNKYQRKIKKNINNVYFIDLYFIVPKKIKKLIKFKKKKLYKKWTKIKVQS